MNQSTKNQKTIINIHKKHTHTEVKYKNYIKLLKRTTIPLYDNELRAQNVALELCKTVQKLYSFKETMMSDILSVLAKPKKLLNTFMVAGFTSVETGNSIVTPKLCCKNINNMS